MINVNGDDNFYGLVVSDLLQGRLH